MAEVAFYHLQRSTLAEALPKLLEKALAAGFRVVLRIATDAELGRLNTALWTYGEGSFLPHGCAADGWAAQQPIYLTASDENPNGGDMLVQVTGAEWGGDLGGFRRVLDLFDGADGAAVEAARERWRRYRAAGHTLTYWQQSAKGGWERKDTT